MFMNYSNCIRYNLLYNYHKANMFYYLLMNNFFNMYIDYYIGQLQNVLLYHIKYNKNHMYNSNNQALSYYKKYIMIDY